MPATDRRRGAREACATPVLGRVALTVAALAVALAALVVLRAAHGAVHVLGTSVAASAACEEVVVTTGVVADSWIDENSPLATKGSDAILSADGGSVNIDTGLAAGRARALVRFGLPGAIPEGCVVASARLYLWSSEESAGARAEVVQLASAWSEETVSWQNQPASIGAGVASWSRDGYMWWNVTALVELMIGGANHGFLIRDSAEGAEEGGAGHGFYAREKGENPARLEIRFAPPPTGEPPGPPEPPQPANVVCGQTLTKSTVLLNDLLDCLGDGLVIGAPNIIVDLGGHTIDGVGLGSGVLNDAYSTVTVRNGTIREFDHGVNLLPSTELNVVQSLTLLRNEVGAVDLFDVRDTEVRDNMLDGNGGGISLVSGTSGSTVEGNTVTANGKAGLFIQDADNNRLEGNRVSGGGDLGIGLERASGNTVVGNTVSANSDGAIELRAGSHGNRLERNTVTYSGDHGILVDESDRNELISNSSHGMSDSGITLETANDGVVRGNDVRFNTGGLQVDGSSRNLIEENDASATSGIGIELGGGSYENVVSGNLASGNGAAGISVGDDAADPLGVPIPGLGNLIVGNVADGNGSDGITASKGGHTITANLARDNGGWGVNAALNSIDGGFNVASDNVKPGQCVGVVCKAEWNPPETTITGAPPEATSESSAQFAFTGADDVTPESGLRFECRLDAVQESAWRPCTSPRSYAGLGAGPHVFEVRAVDFFDNRDPTPARHSWTVDATSPETTIETRPDAETAETVASFVFSANAPGATFACSLDSGPFESCASPAAYADLADGPHEFRVAATDRAGKSDPTPASYSWIVDATPPETSLDGAPPALTTSTVAIFAFSSADADSSFACSVDGAAYEACESAVVYAGLAEGAHEFQVRARDRVGNVDPSPARHVWTVDTVAPETAIDSAPPALTNGSAASFVFGSELGAAFECRLDAADWEGCESPKAYAALADGAHEFEVRARDAAGNVDATPAAYVWIVDTVAPETTIQSGPAGLTNSSAASFVFSSEPGAAFECLLDGGEWQACESPKSYAALTDGAHVFEVRARDAAGNVDADRASHRWSVDTGAPETAIDSGPAALTNSSDARFVFSSEPGTSFECRLDVGEWGACESPQTYSSLADGAHRFEVRAADAAGNVDGSPASYSWTVDSAAPETTILSGPPALTNSTSASFAFGSEAGAAFECRLDGGAWESCQSPKRYAALPDGVHEFEVRATDAAGKVDPTPAGYVWIVDTTAPETAIDAAPADPSHDSSPSFAFNSEPRAAFECRLDEGAWAECESPKRYAALADGVHEFEVRAIDAAGNIDASPAGYVWTVDTAAPETAIESAPPDPSNDNSPSFAFSSETGAAFECRLDEGPWQACESPKSYTALPDGPHAFAVRAIDPAGNVDASPATQAWTLDTSPPASTIASGPPARTQHTSASFIFSADEPGATFACSLDDDAHSPCASPQEYSGLAPGTHRFRVRATDRAGNVEPEAASHEWTITAADTTAPETTIGSAPPALSNSTSASFHFTGSDDATDPSELTFECRLDGAAFASCSSPQAYSGLADGPHSFGVRAIDGQGNTDATPAAITWSIDTTVPDTTIPSGPPTLTNSTSATFTFSASEPGSTFECSLDGGAFAACIPPREYTALAAGVHDLRVRATDPAGNTDASPATRTWTVDSAAPETTIDSGPTVTSERTSVTFAFSASEAGSSFECSLDGADFAACSSPTEYAGLPSGAHHFRVRAIDPAGNADPTPASYTWVIVSPALCKPAVATLVAGADSWVLQTSATSNYGADSVIKVDTKAGTNARALVRFALPPIPAGCEVSAATLRLYASSYKTGRTIDALRVAAPWTEGGVTWNSQPATVGPAATAASGSGYREWDVASQVLAMYTHGSFGFLVRDASEDGTGWEQSFHSREKGSDDPPVLVLVFAGGTAAAG